MNFLKLLVFTLVLLQTTGKIYTGKVVFLRGSGCAGKTSLCNQLIKQDSSWKYVEEDGIFYTEVLIHWENEFPAEFAVIKQAIDYKNILHAILRNQILFKSTANYAERLQAKNAISTIQDTLNSRDKKQEDNSPTSWAATLRNQITQTIIDYAQEHIVIVDTWFIKPEHIQRIANKHSVIHVVAYCSFPEIVQRTMKRNYVALINGKDISNLRFFHQALKSFMGTYDLSDNPDRSIASLDKEAIVHALDLVEVQLHNTPEATGSSKTFTRGEFSLQEFQQYREDLLGKFTTQTMYVVPRLPFDMTVRLDENNPAVSAKQIIDFVERL